MRAAVAERPAKDRQFAKARYPLVAAGLHAHHGTDDSGAWRPAPQAAYLVSNHISWLDVLVIGSIRPVCFLAKSEISQWPLIGYLARRAGTLFIKRGQGVQSATRAVTDCLRHGHSVVVFPEGTTSDGSQVKPFYPRLFSVVENHETMVQPLALVIRPVVPCMRAFLLLTKNLS